ncbi:hypothetical protein N9284_02535 [Halieaceae bacterium]|nr:hypothetical protein [Halieaceae bacterium]
MSLVKRAFTGCITLLGVGVLIGFYLESDPDRATPSKAADVPVFIGTPATAKPVEAALAQPLIQHPFLAPSGVNSMHNDSAQSDAYRWPGPMGNELEVSTKQFHRILGSCVSQTFDSQGRMIGTCVTPFGVTLVARDPETLKILARQSITRWLPIGQKFSGGVYFHLDHEDRVLLATNSLEIQRWVLVTEDGEYRWQLEQSIAIAETLNSIRNEKHLVIDVIPDWQGNYWFITRAGLVGMIDRQGESGQAVALNDGSRNEGIDNALAVSENGVFVVSDQAMYNFERGRDGAIRQQWREAYDRGQAPKLGTMGHGSGTTPTLMANDYVAITDNADGQINVIVYAQKTRDGSQLVCKQGVFPEGKGTSENSMAVVGNGLIVENNYGYFGPKNTPNAEPGIARVNVLADQQRCELAWENLKISSPSAVPKVSLANGLVYLYTRDENNPDDLHAWYFTAVDVETGKVVYKQLTGVGWLFNNHYGSITLSPDGTAYVGMMGGLVKIKDGS